MSGARLFTNTTGAIPLNISHPYPEVKPWNYVSGISLVIFLAAVITNSVVLWLFIRHGHLRTPFTTYIMNLLVANLFNEIFQQPLTIISKLRTFSSLGTHFCTAFLYGSYIIHSLVYNSHFLITLNRIWAVTHPVSYHQYHTRKVALCTCLAFWMYIHLVMLPGFIQDAMFYRIPLSQGCYIVKQTQYAWFVTEQLMLYDIPLASLILAYPLICFFEVRRRVRHNRLILADTGDLSPHGRGSDSPASAVMGQQEPQRCKRARKQSSTAFVVLTMLTLSNCLFMLPLTVEYNWSVFGGLGLKKLPGFYEISNMLFYSQAVFDPILFTLALTDLHATFQQTFGLPC
ncbi:hypothetical protein BV898_08018 [Hypsibius exemplaris]|uniref:G-protein coupled receptors family 1 profile domain-containing protein n=1 Tax=Hypsibius exemplaris TaxID=2072580 RepID=A0A1W0WRV1_HYPEX|nr:hypothetical protein BV898_08018 [Hypsibius exemplaris]